MKKYCCYSKKSGDCYCKVYKGLSDPYHLVVVLQEGPDIFWLTLLNFLCIEISVNFLPTFEYF